MASNRVEECMDEMLVDHHGRQVHALTEIAKTLTLPLDLPDLLDRVIKKIVGVLEPAEVGIVMLWDHSGGLFRPAASFGFDPDEIMKLGLRAGESITGKVFDDGTARLLRGVEAIAHAMEDMRPANRKIFFKSIGSDRTPLCVMAAPISVGEVAYGVLILETLKGPAVFEETDMPFLQSIADLIGLAIDRARLETKADAIRSVQESERMRSELMATLSHELRMPLTAIKGYATALLIDDIDWRKDQSDKFLHRIDKECDNMQLMIKEILDSSLIDVNQLHLELEPVRIQHLAAEVASEVQSLTANHQMVVDFSPDFPMVDADPRWIRQVLRNLLDNAIKYSPDGGLIVIRGETRLTQVVLSISDQGIGISPEDLIPLFEKFFRVRSANGYRVPGTGLGLPIARAIIEAHGGRIWVESKVEHGTTAYFSLPLAAVTLSQDE